jgi:uncharacterized protein VirK/YbjX
LPKLETAQFDGNADSWIQFRDQYEATIHENADLQSVQKFRYLLSFLKDEAKELVADITLSNYEYNTAWNLLLQHYNNPLKIIKSYIQPLFERQDGLKSLEETQKTVRQINRITRGLPKLGKIGTAETPWILAVL